MLLSNKTQGVMGAGFHSFNGQLNAPMFQIPPQQFYQNAAALQSSGIGQQQSNADYDQQHQQQMNIDAMTASMLDTLMANPQQFYLPAQSHQPQLQEMQLMFPADGFSVAAGTAPLTATTAGYSDFQELAQLPMHYQQQQQQQQPLDLMYGQGMIATPPNSSYSSANGGGKKGGTSSGSKRSPNRAGKATPKRPKAATSNLGQSTKSIYTPKYTPKRTTLTAYQQLVTLQFFYDVYPEDTYVDEDVFRLSHACGLDFDLTKRRLANLNGKQRELRRTLFSADAVLSQIDYDIIVDILVQAGTITVEQGNRIHPKGITSLARELEAEEAAARASNDSEAGSDSDYHQASDYQRASKRARVDVGGKSVRTGGSGGNGCATSSGSSTNEFGRYGLLTSSSDDVKNLKRLGKDDRVLIEIHHRQLLGAGFTVPGLYVMGQSKTVKEWLEYKREEVRSWLSQKLGPDAAPALVGEADRPDHKPTTASELLDSDLGPAYLNFKANQRAGPGGSPISVCGKLDGPDSVNGGGGTGATALPDGSTLGDSISNEPPVPNAITVHAGSSVFITPNEDFRDDLKKALHDLRIVLERCTVPQLMPSEQGTGEGVDIETTFSMMYLWLQPKLLDQRSIRSELALKDPVACDHSMSLVDQIYQTVVELRQARKLPVGMILSVAAMTLADGQPALLLTLNKTVHHPLYILPGVSPKSAHPKPPHFSPSRKRGRSGSGNDDSEDVLSQALSARLDNWLDDWLLVQDRAQHRLTSDMVFIRRGSYSSACVPRPRDKNSADMAKNDPKAAKMARLGITVHTHHEATIQPTEQQARCLNKLNLDMVGRPWKHLALPSENSDEGEGTKSSSGSLSTIVYHFKRTVTLDALDGALDESEFVLMDAVPATPTKDRSAAFNAAVMLSPTLSGKSPSLYAMGSATTQEAGAVQQQLACAAEWEDLDTPKSENDGEGMVAGAATTSLHPDLSSIAASSLSDGNTSLLMSLESWKDTWANLDDSALMPSTIQGVDGGNLFSMMMMGSTDNIFGSASGNTDDLTLSLGGSEGGTIDPMLVGLDSTLDQINAQSEAVTSGASTESILAPSAASVPSAEQEEVVQPSSHSPPPPTVGGKWKPRGSAFTPCATKVHRSVSLGNQNIDSVMTSAPHDVTLSAPPARRIKSLNFANLASPPQQQQQQHLFENNLPMLSPNIGGIDMDKLAACIDAHHSSHQAHPSSIMPSFMNFDPFSNLQGVSFAQKVPGGGNGGGWPSDQWFLRLNPFDAAAAPTTTTTD